MNTQDAEAVGALGAVRPPAAAAMRQDPETWHSSGHSLPWRATWLAEHGSMLAQDEGREGGSAEPVQQTTGQARLWAATKDIYV